LKNCVFNPDLAVFGIYKWLCFNPLVGFGYDRISPLKGREKNQINIFRGLNQADFGRVF
jgi:hypothetical protein